MLLRSAALVVAFGPAAVVAPPPPPPPNPLLLTGCATRFGALAFATFTCTIVNPVAPVVSCCRNSITGGQCSSNTNSYIITGDGSGAVTYSRGDLSWSYTMALTPGSCTYTNGVQYVNLFCGSTTDLYFGTVNYSTSIAGGSNSAIVNFVSPLACALPAAPAAGSCIGTAVVHRYLAADAAGSVWPDRVTSGAADITLLNNASASAGAVLFNGPSSGAGAGGYGQLAPFSLPLDGFCVGVQVRFDLLLQNTHVFDLGTTTAGARVATPTTTVRWLAVWGRLLRACR
jgi:hypothetical protein